MKIFRACVATTAAAAALCLWCGVAAAHVSLSPSSATQGSYAKLTFRVPNERDDASTVKLEVKLPDDPPFASVSVKPVPGWTAEVQNEALAAPITTDDGDTITERASTVTWTGGSIEPGQFQEFEISVGPLPDVESLTFPALQTYSSGEEVAWIQTSADGQPEPEHPAPVLTLTGAGATGAGPATTVTAAGGDTQSAAPVASDGGDDSSGLAVAALVVAIVAAGLAVVGLVVRRPGAKG
jgi:uncharacterized protein YcnI